jgi:SNF2 family DNA or RNA helicase
LPNPKIAELLEVLEETDEKAIIWASFVPEIHQIVDALLRVYGTQSVVAYYGGINKDGRADAIKRFTEDPDCRFFVTNQQTGSVGLNLTAATLAVYYSNSFSLEDRLQSEDRCHRTGQKHAVTYVDLVMNLPVEKDVIAALKSKKSLATFIADKISENNARAG